MKCGKSLTVLVICVSSFAWRATAQEYTLHKAPDQGYAKIDGNLVIQPPVNVNGPNPYILREVHVGDLVLVQIRYPIVPPMPTAVTISTDHKSIEFVSTARSTSEAAILSQKPQTNGKIGVGYVQLLVRPMKAGKEQLTAHVKLFDGSVKNVPFAFDVKSSDQ